MKQKKSPYTLEFYGWLLLPVGITLPLIGLMLLLVAAGQADSVPPRASLGPNTLSIILERMVSHPDAVDFTILGALFIFLGILCLVVLPLGIWTTKRRRRKSGGKEPFLDQGITGAGERWAKPTGSETRGEGITMEDTERRLCRKDFDDDSPSRVPEGPSDRI
jgi:hypothetical protein